MIRRREPSIRHVQAVKTIERLYIFAEWTLDETVRDLISPAGQRVDLTSSEFDLLIAFLRQPVSRFRAALFSPYCADANGTISTVRSTDDGRATAQET